MKIYNISDTKRFFEVLSDCTGDIELVSRENLHISLSTPEDRENLKVLSLGYIDGTIDQMELNFRNPQDAVHVLEYLANKKNVA